MNSLIFKWIAILKNNNIIYQFDKDLIEHRFQEVIDNFNNLTEFRLIDNDNNFFSVDLKNGLISYNCELKYPIENNQKNNIRLIFFRRHRCEISDVGKILNDNTEYHLGFQYNDENGKNQKNILIITKTGWILGE